MEGILRDLYGAVLDCIGWVFPTVHLFSTQVADVTIQDLRSGKCQSTGGTDIGCVASHMAKNRVRRAVLVTDGWVGSPRGEHLRTLELARLAVAYMGNGFNERDLADVANFKDNLKIGN